MFRKENRVFNLANFLFQSNLTGPINQSTPNQKQSQSIPTYHQPAFEPPPSLITLRPEPPISQVNLVYILKLM